MEYLGFPGGSDSKESACNTEDPGWISGSGRFPGEGTGYPRQYSCLENSMDIGAWRATVHGVTKSQARLSTYHTDTHTHTKQLITWSFSIRNVFFQGFPGGTVDTNPPANAGDTGSVLDPGGFHMLRSN